ncbi:hypothetical protein EC604_08060 [Paenibacillus amylolyticus]|uniref:UTP--glucose-1-phosphate uridylyltransferase n=1 Tax=Paenibacillus amylolyticus TaxID=1451 RepID=A0A5M9WQM8_PAEAM|nr:sugar phosphate nucleotidyltransferase [Paenibacillus amylolyticus]KAA8783799.1 hypothetical protein EC604_08060 [Paenibacillus amylolyticus]
MKAIIPASGKGTRMKEITNSMPKELLYVGGKPLIDHAVTECIDAGIKEIIVSITQEKLAIKDYFLRSFKENSPLSEKMKESSVSIQFVIQDVPDGTGGAIIASQHIIGSDGFLVVFPDVLVSYRTNTLKEMIELQKEYDCPIVMVDSITKDEFDRYGVTFNFKGDPGPYFIDELYEKPGSIDNFSLQFHGIVGRYVFPNDFIQKLEYVEMNKKNEIDLTDALVGIPRKMAQPLDGRHFDCGSIGPYKRNLSLMEKELQL